MRKLTLSIAAFSFLLVPFLTNAQVMSSGTYGIQSDSVNFGGGNSVSASYGLEDTAGEIATGDLSGTTYDEHAGYQQMLSAVATDILPPTAPASITATAQSFDRIEVMWGQSTDNVGVTSYKIYRDGVSLTNVATFPRDFVDTGLTASTTYTYTVSALDAAGNESPQSVSASATTFGLPAAVSASGGTNITSGNSTFLYNFSLIPAERKALVTFNTYLPMKVALSYGIDTQYGKGTINESTASTTHSFLIKSLTPSTLYHLKLVLTSNTGAATALDDITFRTSVMPNNVLPPNATNFKAIPGTDRINLSWQLPKKADITSVRVVRSTNFYPATPDDGQVVFEGLASQASDLTAVAGVHYYYSLFTENFVGTFSSGAVTDAEILLPGQAAATTTPLQNLPQATNVDPQIAALTLKDFLFVQNGDSLPLQGDTVVIDGKKNLQVALMYYRVPAVLKTIAVTLVTQGSNPQSFTFILRANADKTRYEATIAPLGVTSAYTLHLTVVDFKNQGLKSIDGVLNVAGAEAALPQTVPTQSRNVLEMILIALVLLALWLIALIRRKKERAEQTHTVPA